MGPPGVIAWRQSVESEIPKPIRPKMPHSPTGDCESLRSSARDAAEAGRADDAAMLYRQLLGSRPDDLEALNFLGIHAMAHGWFPRAREMLERALVIARC